MLTPFHRRPRRLSGLRALLALAGVGRSTDAAAQRLPASAHLRRDIGLPESGSPPGGSCLPRRHD